MCPVEMNWEMYYPHIVDDLRIVRHLDVGCGELLVYVNAAAVMLNYEHNKLNKIIKIF